MTHIYKYMLINLLIKTTTCSLQTCPVSLYKEYVINICRILRENAAWYKEIVINIWRKTCEPTFCLHEQRCTCLICHVPGHLHALESCDGVCGKISKCIYTQWKHLLVSVSLMELGDKNGNKRVHSQFLTHQV